MGENVWDFRKRLTLLVGSAVIIAVVFFIFKVLFYYVWPFMLAFCFAVLLQKPIVGLAKLLREKKMLAASSEAVENQTFNSWNWCLCVFLLLLQVLSWLCCHSAPMQPYPLLNN